MKFLSRFFLFFITAITIHLFLHPIDFAKATANQRSFDIASFERSVQEADRFTMPAEFEPIESVWMAYPTFENRKGKPSQAVQADMIQALVNHAKVDLLVQDSKESTQVESWLKSLNLPAGHVRIHPIPHTDIWTRDMGPIFLKNSENAIKVADFGFNTWSYNVATHPDAMTDETVDRIAAQQLELPTVRSSLISEGGNREFNGKGTLMVTESVELQRNPGLTKQEIETELKRIFNIKKVIWLKQGLADDDLSTKGKLPGDVFTALTTGGHIDEFARFLDAKTIALAQVPPEDRKSDPIARLTHERMEENFRILKQATDQDGQPFTIIRVPVPDSIYTTLSEGDEVFKLLKALKFDDGTTIEAGQTIKVILAASYLNFVVANDVILIPAYWQPGRPLSTQQKDNAVKQLFEKRFPDRKIVQINPENINAGGGGMHCIVQQMPKR